MLKAYLKTNHPNYYAAVFYFLLLPKPLVMKFFRQPNISDLVYCLQPMQGRYVVQAAGIADVDCFQGGEVFDAV